MEMRSIINEFFNESIRVEECLHLGTMCMDEAWPSTAGEIFEDDPDIWPALDIPIPPDDTPEGWGEALRNARKLGYLIQFATPIPIHFYEDNGHSFSWGQYTTQWIYDESFESACEKALHWKKAFIEARRIKALSDSGKKEG